MCRSLPGAAGKASLRLDGPMVYPGDAAAGPLLAELASLASSVAKAAGVLLCAGRHGDLAPETKSSPTDVVTAMDRAAESLIVGRLLAARPDDGILGEEGAARKGGSGVRWVIDPLDGTVNYLYGLPGWAVCIAAELGGAVVVGVVVDALRDRCFVAVRGQGATCNGEPIHCRPPAALEQALIGTGFGYVAERRAVQAQVVAEVLPNVRDIRRFGAAALDLCAVAEGTLDGYYETGLAPWDLAAAGLIATESGAVVGGLHGAAAGHDLVIAAPPGLFGPLHDLLATAQSRRRKPVR
jgi:fructose-1,6-bisphosphatase/inositol monophosphatase family enzyme